MSSKDEEMKNWEWADIMGELNREAKLPLSVHIPLNWPESHKLVMCDCAMNAYTLDTPGLNTSITGDSLIRQLQRTTLFSWAFGDSAFVPDFRQTTLRRVKEATAHLTGLKIAVMGCIVNGPGEMADADYGYVGAGVGRVSLYKGRECVEKNIPAEEAVERLLALIKSTPVRIN